MLKSPWHRQRTPAEKNEHDWLSGVDNSFKQFLLPPRQTKIRTRGCLPAHIRRLTERHNHQIRPLGRRNRRRDPLVATPKNPGSLRAQHVAIAEAPRQLRRKR